MNKLGLLEISILQVLSESKATSLSNAKTLQFIEDNLKTRNVEDLRLTTAFFNKAIMILCLFDLIIVDSLMKTQRFYLSETGILVVTKSLPEE